MKLEKGIIKFLKQQNGASMVMVLSISAIVSVVGVGVVNLSQLLIKTEKQASITREADEVAYHTMTNLRDLRACQNTFKGVDPSATSIETGENVTSIKDSFLPTPRVLYTENQLIGQGTKGRLTLKKITAIKYPITSAAITGPPDYPESNNNAQVILLFEKTVEGKKTNFNRRFLIKVNLDGSGKIDTCFYERDAKDLIELTSRSVYTNPKMGTTAPYEACESIGGVIDPDQGKCRNLTLENNEAIPSPYDPFPAGPYFPTYFGENDSNKYALKAAGKMRITNSLYLDKDPASVDGVTGKSSDKGDIIGSGNLVIDLNSSVVRSMGIGIAAPGVSGKAHFNVAAVVGTGDPPVKGLYVTKFLGVGAGSIPSNPASLVTNIKIDNTLTVEADTAASGNDTIRTKEGIQIKTSLASQTLDDDDAVTRGYFKEHISRALGMDPTIQNEISGYLVSTQIGKTYETMRDAICQSLKIDGIDLGACSFTSSYNISNSSNRLKVDIGTKSSMVSMPHCGTTGECSQVCVDGQCFTNFNMKKCPYRQIMVGIRNGTPICAPDKASWGGF